MKTSRIFLLGAALASLTFGLNSCDLTSETKSTFDESVVFSNKTLAEFNVMSIYEVFGHTNSHRGRYLTYYGHNTDIEVYLQDLDGKETSAKPQISKYAITANNTELNINNGPYNELYIGVERANLAISGLKKYGNIEGDPEMAALYGEALVARALLYAELLKAYGEVPARFGPITPETIYVNKSDKDVIFKQLLSDLEEAAPLLPWPNGSDATSVTTRPSRAFALGLYARFALVASGWSLRPDDGQVGTGNTGSVRRSVDPMFAEPEALYRTALAGLEDVIEHSGCSLYGDYEALWKDFNNFDTKAGKEVIYSLPMSDSRGRWNYTYAIRAEGGSATFTQDVEKSKGGSVGPVPTMYWRYGENDQRRTVSCANFETVPAGSFDRQVLSGGEKWYFGKYRFDWMTSHPYSGGNDDGCKPVYMRYSDILLMAAEIANELGDLAAAKGYLKQVRIRAYKGHESEAESYVDAIGSKDAMFNAIVDERALEFVGEFLRKGDLIRWNLLESKIEETRTEMQALAERSGKFSDISGNVWYKYAADGATITDVWGYEHGQTTAPEGDGWQPYLDSKGSAPSNYFSMSDNKLNSFYFSTYTPNQRQWWPIPATAIVDAQGALSNDYGF